MNVQQTAKLARLRFTPEEEAKIGKDLDRILEYMAQLNALDTENVAPLVNVLDQVNVLREDVQITRISREEALQNAPDADDAYFRVPKVIE
jgi:aspartyl-tRNA(Asn)/glutamyl-tRNA(Gln) amidotransferase subunit C